ncbi:hypothetical protein [Schlesneria paludicola]|uniref:hypothetical protein n=1 Tax=Schlesneria paludicola TaxID=360056 RepID=UPI000299DB99|nr:hypothetical protein [Schlesneria paludicola]
MRTTHKLETATDRKWGFPYGVDGLLSFEKTQELLGGMSRTSIERHVKSGLLRKGGSGKVYFCKRSVYDFIRTLEK